jgi:hypothetical protein
MARVIHMSDMDTVLVDIRYPTRSITISDGTIAHAMPTPMRLELLFAPVPAAEVSVSDMMVGISQESRKLLRQRWLSTTVQPQTKKCTLGGREGRECGRDCAIMYSANSL